MQGWIWDPEEVATAVLFLTSDEATFINGVTLYVDNGCCAQGWDAGIPDLNDRSWD